MKPRVNSVARFELRSATLTVPAPAVATAGAGMEGQS